MTPPTREELLAQLEQADPGTLAATADELRAAPGIHDVPRIGALFALLDEAVIRARRARLRAVE